MRRIGIAGATGLVGETLLKILESADLKIDELRLFASKLSAGKRLRFRDDEYLVEEVTVERFKSLDIAFFCLDNQFAQRLVPEVAKQCPVIDKSSEFRLEPEVPLVVPEVNPAALKGHQNIIANPNCTTIPLVVALNPLHQEFGLKEIFLASYQSVSGAGREALEQLLYENEFIVLGQTPDTKDSPFAAQIADNIIPKIGEIEQDGYSAEEKKTILETKKILNLPELAINSTCVRVPVTVGHSLAITAVFEKTVKVKKAVEILKPAPGVVLKEDEKPLTPLDCRQKNDVFVSRIRQGATENELSLWVVVDNLYKGAATNALQIARLLFSK